MLRPEDTCITNDNYTWSESTIKMFTKSSYFCIVTFTFKVPRNPKFIFRLNKYFYNSEQNGANNFVFGQNWNFL